MSTKVPETTKPAGEPSAARKVNPLLKGLMLLVAVPAMLLRKSQKALDQACYSGFSGSVRQFIGVVLGLAAGIGTGYLVGWLNGGSLAAWLTSGIAALVATYVYAWPLVYLGIVKPVGKLSEALWDAVDRVDRESWFTDVLMFLAYASIIGASGYFGFNIMLSTKAHVGAHWGWFSWLAWPAGIVAGGALALIAGSAAWGLTSWLKMRAVALASGIALVYGFRATTTAAAASFLERFGLPSELTWAAFAGELVIWAAFVFPLVHVGMTHAFGRFIKWVSRLPEKVYGNQETASEYRQFFAQVVNIATTVHLAGFALTLAALYIPGATLSAYAATAVVALLSYTLLGKLVRETSNRTVGVIASAHAAYWAFLSYTGAALWLGWVGALVAAALGALLTFWLVFPLAYVVCRAVATTLRVSLLGKPLARIHDAVFNGLDRVVDEIGHAYDNTYSDSTPYRELFLHVLNLVATAAAVYAVVMLAAALGFAGWLTFTVAGLSAAVGYVLIGKLMLKAGNGLPGALVAIAGGVASGTVAYAYLPHGTWWLVLAVAIGIAGLLATLFAIFPVAYVLLRAVLSPLTVGWLRPVLVKAHDWSWARCADLWQQFVEAYRSAEAWFKPTWDSIARTWDDTWQSVREWWDKNTGGSR